MKLTCNRAKIAQSAGTLAAIAKSGRLDSICMRADDKLTMEATDLDVGARISMEAEIGEPGEILAPAAVLAGVLRDCTGAEVEIEADADKLRIRNQGAKFEILGRATDDFPGLGDLGLWETDSVSVCGAELAAAVTSVRMAVAKHSVQYAMTGIRIEIEEKILTLAGTDTHRLAIQTVGLASPSAVPQAGVVMLKGAIMLEKIADYAEMDMLRVNERMLIAQCGDTLMTSMLIQGKFPNYKKIVPATDGPACLVSRDEFAQAVRQVSHMANAKTRIVKCHLASGQMTISAEDVAGGANATVPAEWSGDDISVLLCHDHIMEMLAVIAEEKVEMYIRDSVNPIMITNGRYRHIIMPYAPAATTT